MRWRMDLRCFQEECNNGGGRICFLENRNGLMLMWLRRLYMKQFIVALTVVCLTIPDYASVSNSISMVENGLENPPIHKIDDLIERDLSRMGLRKGYNSDRKAYVVTATHDFELKNEREPKESSFEIWNILFLKAMGEFADREGEIGLETVESEEFENIKSIVRKRVIGGKRLSIGLQIKDSKLNVELAMVRSEKTAREANCAIAGDWHWMPEFKGSKNKSIQEFINDNASLMMIGCYIVHSEDKGFSLVGVSSYEYEDKQSLAESREKAREQAVYAMECAFGGWVQKETVFIKFINGETSKKAIEGKTAFAHDKYFLKESYSAEGKDFYQSTIHFKPCLAIPVMSSMVKWYEKDAVSAFTGRKIRLVVATLESKCIPRFACPKY